MAEDIRFAREYSVDHDDCCVEIGTCDKRAALAAAAIAGEQCRRHPRHCLGCELCETCHAWETRSVAAAAAGHAVCLAVVLNYGEPSYEAYVAAAAGGHWHCLELMRVMRDDVPWSRVMSAAAANGRTDCMRLIHAWRHANYSNALAAAAKGGCVKSLNLVWGWSYGVVPVYAVDTFMWAAEYGNIECMREMIRKGVEISSYPADTTSELLRYSNTECLELLNTAHGGQLGWFNTFVDFDRNGRSAECLRFAARHGATYDVKDLMHYATCQGDIACAMLALEIESDRMAQAVARATNDGTESDAAGHRHAIDWMLERGFKNAAESGWPECASELRRYAGWTDGSSQYTNALRLAVVNSILEPGGRAQKVRMWEYLIGWSPSSVSSCFVACFNIIAWHRDDPTVDALLAEIANLYQHGASEYALVRACAIVDSFEVTVRAAMASLPPGARTFGNCFARVGRVSRQLWVWMRQRVHRRAVDAAIVLHSAVSPYALIAVLEWAYSGPLTAFGRREYGELIPNVYASIRRIKDKSVD